MAKVLVVDDEENLRYTIGRFLQSDEHEVHIAKDVSESLNLMQEYDFDVVVSDIIMPQVNGMELLSKIREISEDVQVILITGEPTLETAARAVREGAFDYLAKPVNGKEIRKVVAKAVEVKSLIDEKRFLEEDNTKYRKHLENLVQAQTKELKDANKKLKKIVDGIIHAMSITVEKRDPYTAGHQMNVAFLGKAIAEEMNLSENQISGVYMAGLIHDLGKISVPSEILSKPGKLSNEEFALIKIHPISGYDILREIEFPLPIANIVKQHHERHDGSGYPEGLTGSKIVPEAKVLAVADVVEAMAHHRPYRPALGIEKALEEISNGKGVIYDGNVVESCLRLFQKKDYKFD